MGKPLLLDTVPGGAEKGEELRRLKALLPSHRMYLEQLARGNGLSVIAQDATVSYASMQKVFERIKTQLGVETDEEAVALFQRFRNDLDD